MGTRTLQDLWAEVRLQTRRPNLQSVDITRWANMALKEFGYAFGFRELEKTGNFVTVPGTAFYSITSAAADFRMLRETGLRKTAPSSSIGKLKKETREQYQRRIGDTALSSQRAMPVWYHRYGANFWLRPIPDATVYTIEFDYWAKIPDMDVGFPSSVTPFSDDWDEIWVQGAVYRAFRAQGEHDRFINTKNDQLGLIRSRALDEDLEEFAQGGLNIIDKPEDQVTDSD